MKPVTESEISRYIEGNLKRVTNCLDLTYLYQQARLGRVVAIEQENGVILLVNRGAFYSLFYFLSKPEVIKCPSLSKKVFCEVFCRQENSGEEVLEHSGFSIYASYCRMWKKGIVGNGTAHVGMKKSTLKFIQTEFDPYSDSLPILEEEDLFLSENFELKILNEQAVLVYDLKNGISTLKYILVHEEIRGEGVADMLLQEYLNKTAGSAKRYLLWVRENNNIAINLYDKYQYKRDGFRKIVWEK